MKKKNKKNIPQVQVGKAWWFDHEIKPPKTSTATKVVVIESERGWGQRIDSERWFDSREAAEAFCKDYNKDNTAPVAPDWYMVARIA
jgi:hypothetical protein